MDIQALEEYFFKQCRKDRYNYPKAVILWSDYLETILSVNNELIMEIK